MGVIPIPCSKKDREAYPEDCMVGFITWMNARWDEFHQSMGVDQNSEMAHSYTYHDKFDTWLNIKTSEEAT